MKLYINEDMTTEPLDGIEMGQVDDF